MHWGFDLTTNHVFVCPVTNSITQFVNAADYQIKTKNKYPVSQ